MKDSLKLIHVLLADDDKDDRDFFSEALLESAIPSELTTVEDGEKLMDLLSVIKKPPPPDIIFLDINMPRKNGKDCLREIRKNKSFSQVPVVMFSTSYHSADVDETYKDGANLYVSKNFFFENEVKALQKIFSYNWKDNLTKSTKDKFVLRAVTD